MEVVLEKTFRFANISKDNMDIFSLGKVINRLDRCGIFMCFKGSAELLVDDKPLTISQNGLYIYMPSTKMKPVKVSDELEGILVSVDIDYLVNAISRVSPIENILYLRDNPYVVLTNAQINEAQTIIGQLRKRTEEADSTLSGIDKAIATETLRSLGQVAIYIIFSYLYSQKPVDYRPHTKRDIIFFKFLVSLYKNHVRQREVSYYAAEQNLSPRYFSALVKEKSGNSALQWIVRVVIGDIKQLLETTDMTVKEISVMLNFPTQSFFGKYFKQYTGMAPKEYRDASRR
ncbi:MAG: helix-turn-helix domain-containing protein [Bacteroidales bacterium]|nr:helix-turn-helix domain-containing protein [Bacteroidales bacterium]